MAKSKLDRDLFDTLRARGLRKRAARTLAEAQRSGGQAIPKPVRQAIDDLRKLAGELEDRFTPGPTRRTQASRKAAQTRRRNAAKRSQTARKAAQTRTRSSTRARRS